MRDLAGRTALVTGAAGGLGRHLVRALEDEGMQVVVSARDTARLEGLGARAIAADLVNRDDVHRLAREAGEIDVLVNNAGIELTKRYEDVTDGDLDTMIAINLTAPMLLARDLLPGMRERGRGHVVFIASMSGKVGASCNAPYAATKAGLIGMTRALRAEYRDSPVGFSVISPGFIAGTGMWERTDEAAPRAAGEADPKTVVGATVKAIRRDLGDVTVNGSPVRPLLAASVLVPGIVERATWRLGPNELFEREAARRAGG
jgi:NAD(P)-dependent dehydrogenase (short-subunit alcohol dehydrogenase family)